VSKVTAEGFAIDGTIAVLKNVTECGGAAISIPKAGVVGAKTS
jgi:hypothetical protein